MIQLYTINKMMSLTGKNLATCGTWLAQTPFTEVGTFPPLYRNKILQLIATVTTDTIYVQIFEGQSIVS